MKQVYIINEESRASVYGIGTYTPVNRMFTG